MYILSLYLPLKEFSYSNVIMIGVQILIIIFNFANCVLSSFLKERYKNSDLVIELIFHLVKNILTFTVHLFLFKKHWLLAFILLCQLLYSKLAILEILFWNYLILDPNVVLLKNSKLILKKLLLSILTPKNVTQRDCASKQRFTNFDINFFCAYFKNYSFQSITLVKSSWLSVY